MSQAKAKALISSGQVSSAYSQVDAFSHLYDRGVAFAVERHRINANVVGGMKEYVPCRHRVGIGGAVASLHVIGRPLCRVQRFASPGHFGEEIEGERVGAHAFGEDGCALHVGVGAAKALQALGDVARVGAQRDASAEFPYAAEQKGRSLEIGVGLFLLAGILALVLLALRVNRVTTDLRLNTGNRQASEPEQSNA